MRRILLVLSSFTLVLLFLGFGGAMVQFAQSDEQAGFGSAAAAETAFTYQGYLTDNNSPADGVFDFIFLLLLIAAVFLLASLVLAQNGQLALPWYTFAGLGGTPSEGEAFSLSGTVGQTAAGSSAEDNSFSVRGGFWNAATSSAGQKGVYLPILQGSK